MSDSLVTPIAPHRTSDEAARRIEALILDGVLRVGERLPGERELARQLDVSRPVLRDALHMLEGRGLVITRAGGGTVVADIVGEVFKPPIVAAIARHGKATADYLEFRREIDGLAADYAARRATPDDRRLIEGIVARMAAAHAKPDFAEEAALDVELHNSIGEAAHNLVLLHVLRACYRLVADGVFTNRAVLYGLPAARDALLAQHRALADAVIAGDPVAARRAAEDHIAFVAEALSNAERADEWRRVSRLRMTRRAIADSQERPARP